ncbi:hypothetical protein HK105_203876 [Polyrhizophydium stewartii]|uniref:Ankyrin repeat domain-containing protein n=1 Tax=Polyrhizophydium stewartii TaxID=2732419 RepID=A0ABR4NAA2_9FUNG
MSDIPPAPRPGGSQWDRMAPELRRMVMSKTSMLTKLANRAVVRADLRWLPAAEREGLWAEAFETEWSGDLASLSHVDGTSACFGLVRSRGMLERLRQAWPDWVSAVETAAVANGWLDAVDDSEPSELAAAAARLGAVPVLQHLIDERKAVHANSSLAITAAANGHLGAVQFILERAADAAEQSEDLMAAAAGSGNLELVAWVYERCSAALAARVVDAAVAGGHGGIAIWLADHGAGGCSLDALADAAVRGHLDVLLIAQERFPDSFRGVSDTTFADATDLRVLQWLHSLRLIVWPSAVLQVQVLEGSAATVAWVCETFELEFSQDLFELACEKNRSDIVRWALAHHSVEITQMIVIGAVWAGAVGALDACIERDGSWLEFIGESAPSTGSTELVEWLHARHPAGLTPRTLEDAAVGGHLGIVLYLLERVSGIKWDLERALARATKSKRNDVVDLLKQMTHTAQTVE